MSRIPFGATGSGCDRGDEPMTEFASWKQYGEFRWFVMRHTRYIGDWSSDVCSSDLIETSTKRRLVIKKKSVLWRAQLDHALRTQKILDRNGQVIDSFDVEVPSRPKRMMPLPDRANEGGVNPKGIPCLYFSTDKKTAMTETRPWIGSCVSVAQFVMLRDLTVVDCSADSVRNGFYLGGGEPKPGKREEYVWGDINRAFSEPVTRTDDVAEYAPTQVLAEAFRSADYDGIVYGSKLGTGMTVAVFDLTAGRLVARQLCRVKGVRLEFSEEEVL